MESLHRSARLLNIFTVVFPQFHSGSTMCYSSVFRKLQRSNSPIRGPFEGSGSESEATTKDLTNSIRLFLWNKKFVDFRYLVAN